MIKILILFLLVCSNAFADSYAVEKPDGTIVIAHYFENSSETLDEFLASSGLAGLPVSRIETSTLPPRADRKYWKRSGGRVVVDTIKKNKDLQDKAQKEAAKQAVLLKLKISAEELEALNAK